MPELPGLVASTGGADRRVDLCRWGPEFRLAGRLLRRPFGKVGAPISYAALAAVGFVAGLYLLAAASLFSLPGSDRIEGLLAIGIGLIWIAASIVACRWVARYDIPDATWQRTRPSARRP